MKRIGVIAAIVALSALSVPAAHADVEVVRRGHCTNQSHWSLELDLEGSRIEVDFEGHTPRAGQTWRIVMRHNGTTFWNGARVTERDGDFEVDKIVGNFSGTDTIWARAVNRTTGEVCKGSASI